LSCSGEALLLLEQLLLEVLGIEVRQRVRYEVEGFIGRRRLLKRCSNKYNIRQK
jgi:hypothetical protein